MSNASTNKEPAPDLDNPNPDIWPLVVGDLRALGSTKALLVAADGLARDAYGKSIYGIALKAHNGRDVLTDAYQEVLDLVAYLRQAIEEGKDTDGTLASIYVTNLNHAITIRSRLGS